MISDAIKTHMTSLRWSSPVAVGAWTSCACVSSTAVSNASPIWCPARSTCPIAAIRRYPQFLMVGEIPSHSTRGLGKPTNNPDDHDDQAEPHAQPSGRRSENNDKTQDRQSQRDNERPEARVRQMHLGRAAARQINLFRIVREFAMRTIFG